MNQQVQQSFLRSLLPTPQKIEFLDGDYYKLFDDSRFLLLGPEDIRNEALEITSENAGKFWHFKPDVKFETSSRSFPKEGYCIDIQADLLTISASDISGFRFALYTLRQLAQTERKVKFYSCFILPQCKIEDYPTLEFRGIHLCWFPETSPVDIEKAIRLAASLKYNAVVLESWGVFPFECAPDFYWKDKHVPKAVFAHLTKLSKELGIELIPQINITGHASWSRGGSGKHAILSVSPQYESLFEPCGWCWCLTNPETRKLLAEMISEIHEAYGNPPHFHIGCDEAHSLGTCCECAAHDTAEIFREHLVFFHDLLQKRGAQTMLWHDMFLDKGNPEFEQFVRCGRKEFAEMLKDLPKDLLICDWEYCGVTPPSPLDFEWKSSRYFFEQGFHTVLCPWEDPQNARSQAAFMARNKEMGKGILVTTWHWFWGHRFTNMIGVPAQANWNSPENAYSIQQMARYVRQIDQDMGLTDYTDLGYRNSYQVSPDAYPLG